MAKPTDREPCPDRIIDDIGGAFAMGTIGGSVFHFFKGLYNSSRGQRFRDGRTAVGMNAPRVGGSFAAWGGVFSACDCTMVYLRQKEDPWNSIVSGALTGGVLVFRRGARKMAVSALFGGGLMALMEGAVIMFNKLPSAPEFQPVPYDDRTEPPSQGQGAEVRTTSSWFGGGKEEAISTAAKTEVLESFDTPVPPTFDFSDMF